MKVKDITNLLDELYPEYLKASYDNVGLMVGSYDKEVKRVFVALDLTREVMDEALASKADLIITHHPLLFRPLYQINTLNDPGSIIKDLINNDITLFAMHTNFDTVRMNDLIGSMLEIENREVLSEKENCGIVGDINESSLIDFINHTKKILGLDEILYVGDESIKVSKVALCAGSGSSMINDAKEKNADVFLTGDLSYSRAIEARRLGQNILVIPHHIEYLFYKAVIEELHKLNKDLDITVSKIDPNPFRRY